MDLAFPRITAKNGQIAAPQRANAHCRISRIVVFATTLIHSSTCLVATLLALFMADSGQAWPRQLLRGHVPVGMTNSTPLRRLAGSQRLTLSLGLPLRNQAALTNLMEQIYDPESPNYHQYLTPQQFAENFGTTAEDYQALMDFARAHGFKILKQHSTRTLLTVDAAAAAVENAFQVKLHAYRHPRENREFFAPDTEPTIDIGIPVLGIGGLNNFVVPRPMSLHLMPTNHAANATPAAGSDPSGLYIGRDFRNAYVPGVSLDGTGQSVALLEFDSYYSADIASYKTHANLPDVTVTNVAIDGFTDPPGSANIEVALDIEMAISMAPGLSRVIVYEASPNSVSGDDMLENMATNNLANQISSSWTFPIDAMSEQFFTQFAMQGQTYFNASGDSGAYTAASPPESPSDDPNVISVGGTTLTTTAGATAWVSETTWNWFTTRLGTGANATSGGTSRTYNIPTYQQGISMTANKGSTFRRNIPDVAMVGDNIIVYFNNGGTSGVGGTSCSAPLWAGFTALLNQRAAASGKPSIGFANPAIYAIGKSANFTTDFHDITTGNNTNLISSTKFFAVAGYDLCTGFGTPNGANMIFALVPGAPLLTRPLTNEVVMPGDNATFAMTAVGGSLFYHWQLNSNNIPGATNASFTVTNAQTTDQGFYGVVVSNSLGAVTSAVVTLVVSAPPTIASQPQDQTVPQGNDATFTVTPGGPAPFTFQWRLNNANIFQATNSSYTVLNAQLANQGNYSVIVSNSGGTITSSNAVLTVNAAPVIGAQPISHTVNQGGTVIFSVSVAGSPVLAYQWVFAGSNILSATNAILGFQKATASQAGSYWVVITNNFGCVTSSVVTLTVNSPPAVTTQPLGANLVVGDQADFSVIASGSTPMNFQWQHGNSNLTDNARITGSQDTNLIITSVLVSDAGNYQLFITNAFGFTNSLPVTLTVSKATPFITWSNPAAITYGTELSGNQLNATASQPGILAYDSPIGFVPNAGTNILSVFFTPIDGADFNSASASVSLKVCRAPLTVTAADATRVYGQENPAFTADITGAVNGDVFSATANCDATVTNLPGTYPIVPNLTDSNNRLGNYSVTSGNGTLTITPADPPTITGVTPNSGTTNGGDTVTISGTGFQNGATVNFGSLPAISINVTNATNIIVVTPPAVDLGMVDVVLTNMDGQTAIFTNGFTYVVPPVIDMTPAQITGDPTNQSVLTGGLAAFVVTAAGAPPLAFQWTFNQTNLPDATNCVLTVSNVQAFNAGAYQAIVTNLYGAATSAVATLSVPGVPVALVAGSGGLQFSNGQISFQITGLTGQGDIVIQSSPDLTNWTSIFTNASGFGQFQFTDTNAGTYPQGFYRAITPAAP